MRYCEGNTNTIKKYKILRHALLKSSSFTEHAKCVQCKKKRELHRVPFSRIIIRTMHPYGAFLSIGNTCYMTFRDLAGIAVR